MSDGPVWSISAAWVATGDGRPMRRGMLRGRGSRIEAIGVEGELPPADRHRELGEVVVLPGLVNAHTHLELTHLRNALPPRRPMPQWLFALMRRRPGAREQFAAVAAGAAESLAGGVTALADVSHNHRSWRVLAESPLRKACFAEAMGIGPLTAGAIRRLDRRIAAAEPAERMRFGVAPHAPYSAGVDVYRHAIALARDNGWLVSTHLAETEGERQFLLRGTGRLFDFLGHLGMLSSTLPVHGCKPVEFARRVGLLDGPCLLAHVNYVDDEELDILADSPASVAYCPRSSDFFGRSGHRYAEMLERGINVALGTDSLASNTTLSVLDEMRRVRRDGRVDNATILRMATINGARALGWESEIGTLAPGRQADWTAVRLPAGEYGDPLEAILSDELPVIETAVAGQVEYHAPASPT